MDDVCLILEGTYPYVRGGVSTCVHSLISKLPKMRFSIYSIMPSKEYTLKQHYRLPSNVSHITNVYINDFSIRKKVFPRREDSIYEFFEKIISKNSGGKSISDLLKKVSGRANAFNLYDIFYSRHYWNTVSSFYLKGDDTVSFIDYFWNFRFTFLPLLNILKSTIPKARVYHALSTGFAGFAGALAKERENGGFIVTEHGIYTKERRIEIVQSKWIQDRKNPYTKATGEFGFFHLWWIRFFESLSRLAYSSADVITTLYEGNRQTQICEGAMPEKTCVIQNGIDVQAFDKVVKSRKNRPEKRRRTIAFIGRVVPIKDVKTFLSACRIVADKVPDLNALIVGPQDEESKYFESCRSFIGLLGLENHVSFTGYKELSSIFAEIDVLVLTSISEAQPIVLLEAAACGIPAVTTDAGDCKGILEGKNSEDRRLGPSGVVCSFHSPNQTANEIIRYLTDNKWYEKCSQAALKRVRLYYGEANMLVSYQSLYEKCSQNSKAENIWQG